MSERSCFYCGSVQNIAVVEAYDIGKSIEKERIIKLLEENLLKITHGIIPVGNSGWWEKGMEHAIALIKGEK